MILPLRAMTEENGYTIKVGISQVETIGIDTPEDLAKAEEPMQQKHKL